MSYDLKTFIIPSGNSGRRGCKMWLPDKFKSIPRGAIISALKGNNLFFFELAEETRIVGQPMSTRLFIEPGSLFCPSFDVTKYNYHSFLLEYCRLVNKYEYEQYCKLSLI